MPTELHVHEGAPHGFQLLGDTALSRRAARDADAWLARRLEAGSVG